MSQIEKVARAFCLEEGGNPDAVTIGQRPLWTVWESHARAAIEAMREPTDEQRNEFYRLKKAAGHSDINACFVDADWERAIDAALSEGK